MTPTLSAQAQRLPDVQTILTMARALAGRIRAGDTGRDHATAEALAGTLSLARHSAGGPPGGDGLAEILGRYATGMPNQPDRAVAALVAACDALTLGERGETSVETLEARALQSPVANAVIAHAHLMAAARPTVPGTDAAARATLAGHLRLADQYHALSVAEAGLGIERDALLADRAAVGEYLAGRDIAAILARAEGDFAEVSGRVYVAARLVMQTILSLRAAGA